MKKTIYKCAFIFTAILLTASTTFGQYRNAQPFQASVTPDIALHHRSVMIRGLTLNLWGENPQQALALGLVNGSVGQSSGFSWGYLLNYAESYSGVHWGFVSYVSQDFLGWQGGGINYTGNQFKGVQTGWVNFAEEMHGVQFGLVNFAGQARETIIQVGAINVIRQTRGWFTEFPDAVAPGMVFVNWRF